MEHTFMMVLDNVGDQEAMWCTRSLVSSLLRAPLRRHSITETGTGDALLFERAAS